MNNIGFGIFCFGEDFYFKGTVEKINNILNAGHCCYVLTDKPEYFESKYTPTFTKIIPYYRSVKSYYDKMILPKYILQKHDFCILIDADTNVTDWSFLDDLKTYNFKYGISYVSTLLDHSIRKEYVKDIGMGHIEWSSYKLYIEKIFPEYGELKTVWEYFLVINKNGFNSERFYKVYEKLQVAKEHSDLLMNKPIVGAGEGISLMVGAKMSGSDIQKDDELVELIKDKVRGVSMRHTPHKDLPSFMK